jgi:hypothetical protein
MKVGRLDKPVYDDFLNEEEKELVAVGERVASNYLPKNKVMT